MKTGRLAKRIFSLIAVVFLLLIQISLPVFASEIAKDPYEIYDTDEDLLSAMVAEPPAVIVLRPVMYIRSYYEPVSLSGEIRLTKGKTTSYSVNLTLQSTSDSTVTSSVQSSVNFDYKARKGYMDEFIVVETQTYGDPTLYLDGVYVKEYGQHNVTGKSMYVVSTNEAGLDLSKEYFCFNLGVDKGDADMADGNLGIIYCIVQSVEIKSAGTVSVDTNAAGTPGETGVSVPTMIVVGVLGFAVAGIAAAGISTSASGNDPEDRKKKSSYKMYVFKEFGDSITVNRPPVPIYARMGETTDQGQLIDRPDLSARIIISSCGGISVENSAMAGNYKGAYISAPKQADNAVGAATGAVRFTYVGEGGSFENNVIFKLTGEPYLSFPNRGKSLTATIDMLYGDGNSYKLPIELKDFMAPAELKLDAPDGVPFTLETEKTGDMSYTVTVKNSSTLPDTSIYLNETFDITVTGQNEHESASDQFRINIMPEGLSVRDLGRQFDGDGNLMVACYTDPNGDDDDTEIIPTRFELVLAVSEIGAGGEPVAKRVDMNSVHPEIQPFSVELEKLRNLISVFKYEIDQPSTDNGGLYRICPQMQLPQDEQLQYDIKLPVTCSYADETFMLEIPVRLLGDKLLPMAAREAEIKLLIKRIKMYVHEERIYDLISEIKQDLPGMSVTEIRVLSKGIVAMSQAAIYEAKYNRLSADILDWYIWGLEWIKWIGDQAFSLVLAQLVGPAAPLVDAFLSPAKDLMATLMAEYVWYREGLTGPEEKLKNIETTAMTMLENAVMSQLESNTDVKKAGAILAAFAVIRTINHYWYDKDSEGRPIGFYDACVTSIGDITQTAFKTAVGMKFEAFLKDPKKNAMFGKWADQWLKDIIPEDFWSLVGTGDELTFSGEIFKKYTEEGIGLLAGKLYAYIDEAGKDFAAADTFSIQIGVKSDDPSKGIYVDVNLNLIKDYLFDFIFLRVFNSFPFMARPIEFIKDPPVFNIR